MPSFKPAALNLFSPMDHLFNPAQVTSVQFGQTVLLLKLKFSLRSRRKLVHSVAAFFGRSYGQSYRNLHKCCSIPWGTKICPNWLMVTWGVTKLLHTPKVTLTNWAKGVGACRFTGKPRQQPSAEASTGVDHTSASPDDTNQFGANGSCSTRGFHWETGRRMYDAFSVRENWSQKGLAPRALVVRSQSILLRTWWTFTLYFSLPNWSF